MNVNAKKHYDELLADIYSWMSGDFDERVNQNREFFIKNNIKPSSTYSAIDLGSGHGIHSAALCALGYNVTAVDFSEKLLEELKQNTGNKVKTINADLEEFDFSGDIKPELIVCMGDTLTHLSSLDKLKSLVTKAARNLAIAGKFVISYRDLSEDLKGTSRFIPVKSDESKILTCFLEYFGDHVMVNDILYEKVMGKWVIRTGSYPKLKLPIIVVEDIFSQNGLFILDSGIAAGMRYIISQKMN